MFKPAQTGVYTAQFPTFVPCLREEDPVERVRVHRFGKPG